MKLAHIRSLAVIGTLTFTAWAGDATANTYGSGAPNADQAVASDKISIFQLPRYYTNEIVGLLRAGEQVTIDRCNPQGTWCRVFSSEPTGWVPASYLIGAKAKADATPLESLTTPLPPTQHVTRSGFSF